MGSKLKRLKKGGREGARPGKVSELILEFAQPLFDVMGEPQQVRDLEVGLMLASMCWNLPVLEAQGDPAYDDLAQAFDVVQRELPPVVCTLMFELIERRKQEYGHIPFFVTAEVRGTSLDECRVRAEARMPTEGDDLDARERAALHRSIDESIDDERAGRVEDLSKIIAERSKRDA